jgi:hypothetical protein
MLKKNILIVIGIALLAFYLGRASNSGDTPSPAGAAPEIPYQAPPGIPAKPSAETASQPRPSGSNAKAHENPLADAFARQLSDIPVQGEGKVIRLLADDNKGSRHQRILLALSDGQSVLIAHNIDLAPRIPDIQPGERIGFKGEYVWNNKGGVVHWTHRDPDGRHAGGWLKHRGETYQ